MGKTILVNVDDAAALGCMLAWLAQVGKRASMGSSSAVLHYLEIGDSHRPSFVLYSSVRTFCVGFAYAFFSCFVFSWVAYTAHLAICRVPHQSRSIVSVRLQDSPGYLAVEACSVRTGCCTPMNIILAGQGRNMCGEAMFIMHI